nr:hypothetical protein [Tanacetum cinerariifolium]
MEGSMESWVRWWSGEKWGEWCYRWWREKGYRNSAFLNMGGKKMGSLAFLHSWSLGPGCRFVVGVSGGGSCNNDSWGDIEDESDDDQDKDNNDNEDDNDDDDGNDDDSGNDDDGHNDVQDSEHIDSDDEENPSFILKDYEEEEQDEEDSDIPT